MPSQPIRIAYIAGYGRSGSTILDIALGQHAALVGAGEITSLTQHVWRNNEYCACGKAIRDCSFWSSVLRDWSNGQHSGLMEEYCALQQKFEGLSMVAKLLSGIGLGKQFSLYTHHTKRLFSAMHSCSGREMIVDSSKLPGRAMALAQIPGIDMRVIHLVRDGRGVAWSLLKGYERDTTSGLQKEIKPKSVFRTALRWSMVNLAVEYLSRKLGPERVIRVRYEDFASDPVAVMGKIGAFLELDLSRVGTSLKNGEAIGPGHQVAGNRLRMNTSIALNKDETWRARMPARQQVSFQRLGGWMLRRYGYL
ncbi:sulfotransferase [Sinorhizobium meliloti]|uniref:sulfotransferase family protein n=1 Tax=Rhizobium meliloti TaxID=382 RepID=UPI0002A551B9|nr:sulfotransferase [Sinorhizobium meliloti]AGA10948.1 Sulfotransferase domain protein [Sinorhizobium meliloti GR4]MDW9392877.1 sulfotransferase [Sinorhizobium meliloti]QQF01449.1 sulfotransferase [Sinorhizobium meliloti]RVK94774.1 sulfotransferase [Sinorhizobium meliloti]RVM88261.1 sulfotransferase [Sinorhizobium meliloti]